MAAQINVNELSGILAPGDHIFIPGAIGIPVVFINELMKKPDSTRGVHFLTSIAPGTEQPFDVSQLDPSATVTGLFMQPSLSAAQRSRQYRILPMSYSGFSHYLRQDANIDLSVIQVSPPNEQGHCSLGPSVEFTALAVKKSQRVLALINPNIPFMHDSVSFALSSFDYVCEQGAAPLPEYQTKIDDATITIASHIASLISNGCTLQTGLGKVPTALANKLANHRNLRLHSGLLSDGLMALTQAGALDPNFTHTACAFAGTQALYQWLTTAINVRVRGVEDTHNPANLAQLEKLIAVNSALEVDLFGQCNLEHLSGLAVSGAGGAPDFARAARDSEGGLSIVALNASYKRGTLSRIVPQLSAPGVASLGRTDVDIIITEHGIADLRNRSVHERAQALISIAEPGLRDELEISWQKIAAKL